MKRLLLSWTVVAVAATSCQKEVVYNDTPVQNQSVELVNSCTRSYDEALAIAEDALKLLEGEETRSTTRRVIKRNEGQTVKRPVTRGSETSDEPIMYVFNNEDNQGFTIVAADRSRDPLIAVTELGSYTYGEPTGVEAFDAYMGGVTRQIIIPDNPTLPDLPLVPTPIYIMDTIRYDYTKVGPLLKTKWGQGGVYARETIMGRVGCGPVAIAQIMAYYRYPRTLELTYKNPSTTITLNWIDILKHSIGEGVSGPFSLHYACDCGCDYVDMAQLLREVGERAGIDYGYDADYGGADIRIDMNDACSALIQLGYTATKFDPLFPEYQFYYTEMIADLQKSRPVLLRGWDSTLQEGHIWVADGYYYIDSEIDYYKENPNYNPSLDNYEPQYKYDHTQITQKKLVHFNWGWNGMCDGWFEIDYFVSNDAAQYDDIEANNSVEINFGRDIMLIYNISPCLNLGDFK